MSDTALFSTVPENKYLKIYHHGIPDYKSVVEDYLDFDKRTVACATKIPEPSIRYDKKMPKELIDRLREWTVALEQVAGFFDGDVQKTIMWFKLPNPMLGNISPRDMIRYGRFNKLYKFIVEALHQNIK